jgi:hypothetical protein
MQMVDFENMFEGYSGGPNSHIWWTGCGDIYKRSVLAVRRWDGAVSSVKLAQSHE